MELQEKLEARKQKAFYWVVQCTKIIAQSNWWSYDPAFLFYLLTTNASVNSSCAQVPPPRATAGHLPTLWVPGVGHLQILRCPGVRHLPTQGQPQVFDRHTVSYQNITTQSILLEKQADWLICQGWEKIEEVCKGMFLILCMHFFIAYQARIAKLGSYQCESMFSGYWIKFLLILFEEHPFIKLFIAVITLQCTINFNVNNFITILKP